MRRDVAVTAAFGAALLVAVVAGCSNDSGDSAGGTTSAQTSRSSFSASASSESASTGDSTTPGGPSNLRAKCAGLTSEDLGEIFGTTFSAPTPLSGGRNTFDDISYQTVGCSFDTGDMVTDDPEIEVDLHLSFAEQFSDNTVQCLEPSDRIHPVTPVSGLRGQAWWQSGDFENSTDADGQLTVCVDEALVSIEIEGPLDLREAMKQKAIEIGRIVVG